MKRIFPGLIILIFIQQFSNAQEAINKTKELGINLSGSVFGIRYKTGNKSNLLRLTLKSVNANSMWQKGISGEEDKNINHGAGFNIGFEKRKGIKEAVSFFYGLDLLTSYSQSVHKSGNNPFNSKYCTLSSGLGFVLGFNYRPISNINISAEVVPSISYSNSKQEYRSSDNTLNKYSYGELDYGLSTSGINLTLAYVFGK